MSGQSNIEWTDATWNPTRGCTRVSPGCGGPGKQGGCYAEIMAARFSKPGQWGHGFAEMVTRPDGTTDHRWTGKVALIRSQLAWPKHFRGPRVPVRGPGSRPLVFVNSTSDPFHEALDIEDIYLVLAAIAAAKHIDFQLLTKRPERAREILSNPGCLEEIYARWYGVDDGPREVAAWPLPNLWLGVSAERQQEADERIPLLMQTPAAVRFVSVEPMLGPVSVSYLEWAKLDWVICGGESGPGARPMHPDWARSLRDQCEAAGVPFFFKQWGNWLPWEPEHGPCWKAQNGKSEDHHALFPVDFDNDPNWDDGLWSLEDGEGQAAFQRVGKKAAGRLLDGKEHNGMPG